MDLFENYTIDQGTVTIRIPRQYLRLQPHHQELLKQPLPLFLSCESLLLSDADMVFTYHKPADYLPFARIQDCSKLEQYLILIRVGRFVSDLKKRYSTSFDPRNIFFTQTLDTAFLMRIIPGTIPEEPRTPIDEFMEYKALILSVLQEKYSFIQLVQYGFEVIEEHPLAKAVINAKNPKELEKILSREYRKDRMDERKNRINFSKKAVIAASVAAVLLIGITGVTAFLGLATVTQNRVNAAKNAVYESYYEGNQAGIVENAKKLKDKDMSPALGKIVAEALIATQEPENLHRAFSLDPSRQLDIIDRLILLQKYELITTLTPADALTQVYQAYYAKDYAKVIALVENSADLKQESRAQILLAKAYADINNYTRAEAILLESSKSASLEAYLETANKNRATALSDTDLARRELAVLNWDTIIKLINDIQTAKTKD